MSMKRLKTNQLHRIAVVSLLLILGIGGCGQPSYQFNQTFEGETVSLEISPYPQKSLTPENYTIKVTKDGKSVDLPVEVELKMPDMDMGKNIRKATPKGQGQYIVKEDLSMPGEWQIIVRVDGHDYVFDTMAEAAQNATNASDNASQSK